MSLSKKKMMQTKTRRGALYLTAALSLAALVLPPGAALGQAAGAYSRMGFGARGVAMGGGLVADASGQASPYYNPALAPFTARQHLEASAALLSLDRELQFLQFAAPLRPRAGIAAGLVHGAVTGIDGRDASGFHTDEYRTDEYAFFLAFGTELTRRMTIGLAFQLFRADLLEGVGAVNSIGIDLGLTLRVTEALHVGLAAEDLLARYAWDTSALYGDAGTTTTDAFPRRFRLGAAYALAGGKARLVGEVEARVRTAEVRTREIVFTPDGPGELTTTDELQRVDTRVRLGGEYQLAAPFAVRAGLDRVGPDGAAGLRPSLGFGVEQAVGALAVRAEYAFVREGYDAGAMHLITLRLSL